MDIVLGIDPGYSRCGWAVITTAGEYLNSGIIEHDSQSNNSLLHLYSCLQDIINEFAPSSCGVEMVYVYKNLKTVIPLAQAIGVTKLLLLQNNIPYEEYTPKQIKRAITGYGHSSKEQLIDSVCKLLNIPRTKQHDDVYDAIAIALCHSFRVANKLNVIRSNNKNFKINFL